MNSFPAARPWVFARMIAWVIAFCLASTPLSVTVARELAANPVLVSVKHGDCMAAIKQLNANSTLPDPQTDPQTYFLGGRMLDEGICVDKNALQAAKYYTRAADLGDRQAMLDHAAKAGTGEGAQQNYEVAGDLCRSAQVDTQSQLSAYSLGYACTLRAVAARLLRQHLPNGAFVPGSGERLDDRTIQFTLDVEGTLELGRAAPKENGVQSLETAARQGELRPMGAVGAQ